MMKLETIQNAMDYKKAVITHLFDLKQQIEKGEDSDGVISSPKCTIQVLTQSAMIEGEINLFENEEQKKTFMEYGLGRFEEELNELPPELVASNVTAPIHMKDVRLKSLSAPESITEMDEMIVFSDQIVGMAIVRGKRSDGFV
ncbi:hypothetical protein LCL96_07885 [Rossellomorea aquimaris]|uniref:hypothetical protein n=1 Tax=Rossellomorea aquimaris TaxID=189382 RepID=UPI001CD1FFA6|nr:hypothetical protein [Rossellomorea aquimaris]MCA1058850.1 hypothetical protein [Rossellomorea aquimaris]